MKRHLLNLMTALSLLLTSAVSALWVRSYSQTQGVGYSTSPASNGREWTYSVRADCDGVQLWVRRAEGVRWPSPAGFSAFSARVDPLERDSVRDRRRSTAAWRCLGVQVHGQDVIHARPDAWAASESGRSLLLPFWVLLAITLTLPLARAGLAWRNQRRRSSGLCLRCGYDLRATRGRCPECGTIAPAAPAAPAG
jgi:hypothetical protein